MLVDVISNKYAVDQGHGFKILLVANVLHQQSGMEISVLLTLVILEEFGMPHLSHANAQIIKYG